MKNTERNNKKKKEFSKILVAQESILIWIMTIAFIVLAFICIEKQYFGELPWLSAMVAFPWTAYGVSQGFYYNKAKKENQIKLERTYLPEENFEQDYTMEPQSGQDDNIDNIVG